ncbi:MAG: SDR family oxidoreductase [Proteobacteria bacterium]|nr:SDR family oxidoreductase [Pseudomonadota bacterium]MBU4472442.1 SDR family oxidoreductase [Pseudomonadota bacterium]MCG2751269.1 SDR family oxidoreductase [Desulfobacteraceae bacterium]
MNHEKIASMFSLDGKTALIAGASRGIGEEIARVYGLAGAKLVISSRKPDGIQEAAIRLREQTGAEILAVAANISKPEDRKKLVDEAMAWAGRVDILVNNAGTNPANGPLADVQESAWDKIFEVNLKGPFILSRMIFHAWMKENGGCIINTTSIASYGTGGSLEGAYCITKSALTHLTRILASEWGKHRIRVNAIAPGVIKTRLSQALWDHPGMEHAGQNLAVPRLGEVEDIAGAALLLASKAGELINGQDIIIDNGTLVSR